MRSALHSAELAVNNYRILTNLDAKSAVMTLMTHPDAGVQKEALLAVQKMMVNNWEYLSR